MHSLAIYEEDQLQADFAGMISAKDLSHEIALKRKAEQERFDKLEVSLAII